MSVPRKHHFIPIFYLKKWLNHNCELIEYSRPYKGRVVSKLVGASGTGFEHDLYSFHEYPKDIALYLESKFLQRADGIASIALMKLIRGDSSPWSLELRSAWSRFVINLLIRHPHPFAEVKRVFHEACLEDDELTQLEYSRLRQPDDPATFSEWLSQRGYNLRGRLRLNMMQRALDNELAGGRLNSMIWHVVDLRGSAHKLLTSDWPVYREVVGERVLFALPIGPYELFVAVSHAESLNLLRKSTPTKIVRFFNRNSVTKARLYVYASDRSQDAFIVRYMSTAIAQPPFFPSLGRFTRENA